ncbi:hypothetical protein D3C71_1921130 [compost metagenome]
MQFRHAGAERRHAQPDPLLRHGAAHQQDLPETRYRLLRAVRWRLLGPGHHQLLGPGGDGAVCQLPAEHGHVQGRLGQLLHVR